MIGFFFLLFGIMRMGWVASFIPTLVMRGFIEGLVYVTIIGQVPHVLKWPSALAVIDSFTAIQVWRAHPTGWTG